MIFGGLSAGLTVLNAVTNATIVIRKFVVSKLDPKFHAIITHFARILTDTLRNVHITNVAHSAYVRHAY